MSILFNKTKKKFEFNIRNKKNRNKNVFTNFIIQKKKNHFLIISSLSYDIYKNKFLLFIVHVWFFFRVNGLSNQPAVAIITTK